MVSLGARETSPCCGGGCRLPGLDGGQRLGEQDRAAVRQPLQQVTGGVLRADGFGQGAEDGAGVQPFLEQEGDGAGDVIAGDDGALHRARRRARRAAGRSAG